MAIQGSGQIKLTELATEFGGTAPYSLKAYYNGGGRVPSNNTNVPTSGAIGLKNFYNAVNRVALSVILGTNTTQTSVNITALPGYIAGITDVNIYVSSNVYVYSTTTSTPALSISGSTAGDTVKLTNNGYVMGKGGDGNSGWAPQTGGTNGGPALSIGSNIFLINNSYIAGGGGGGGGRTAGGGGAGGGQGGNGYNAAVVVGGLGGGPGQAGADGDPAGGSTAIAAKGGGAGGGGGATFDKAPNKPGGGGGRILPGVGGAGASSGGGSGGTGGSANNAGSLGSSGVYTGGGGGGWGAAGAGQTYNPGSGGAAIQLNGKTITYITTGTIYGSVA